MSSEAPSLDRPGFDLYANQQGRIIGSLTAILIITTLSVALRLLSRKLARAGFWWDDHLAVLAWFFDLLLFILSFFGLRFGFGRHISVFGPVEGPKRAKSYLRNLWIFELCFHTTTTLAKYSILAFYYRIFPVPPFRRLLVWVAVLCTVYMVAIDLALTFQCQPIHYTWDRVLGSSKGHCVNVDALFIGSGSCNAALNLVVFILPIPLLWRLRATAKQQAILTIIFTLAGFGLLVSIIWIVVLAGREEMDVTWNYISTGIWSVLEPSMAVTCASIPSLRPLYSIAVGGFRNMSASVCRSNRMASNTGRTKRATWLHSGPLRRQPSDGMSSPNGKPADDIKPFGHGVSIRGGRQGDVGEDAKGMELPLRGIQVKTEVVITTEQLEYKDRLF